jgi:tetratricopeptide (TPR) repeat protein
MESVARALRPLQEEANWFVRATEVKLLRVHTTTALRNTVLSIVMGYEAHADNKSLFFRLDDPYDGPSNGWPARIVRLYEQFVKKAEGLAEAGTSLPPLAEPRGQSAADFGGLLHAVAQSLRAPLAGVVVAISPVRVGNNAQYVLELGSLIRSPVLQLVRWIAVEPDERATDSLVAELGSNALSCDCVVDDEAEARDLEAMGAAKPGEEVVPRATLTWRPPGAGPPIEAPLRKGGSPPADDETLRAAGLNPAFINGGAEALKRLTLGGALALKKGRHGDAVGLQARAAELCGQMGMFPEQVINLIVLGGYLLAGSARNQARDVYQRAGEIAVANGHHNQAAQADLALGMLEASEQRPQQAITHYTRAAQAAEAAKNPALAIECWRIAGQLALDQGAEGPATQYWQRALQLAQPLEAKTAKATGAAEVARALAAVCRKRGLIPQAESLERQGFEFEHGLGKPMESVQPAQSAAGSASAPPLPSAPPLITNESGNVGE